MADYKSRKQEIIDKARKQPMLMERVSKRDEKIEKMKKLWEISQTLLKNGIRGKDHDHYFKREELIFIEDYKQLKDKLWYFQIIITYTSSAIQSLLLCSIKSVPCCPNRLPSSSLPGWYKVRKQFPWLPFNSSANWPGLSLFHCSWSI